MNKNVKILVCSHKYSPYIRTEDPYLPIQVGKALHPDLDLGFVCDNEGENISQKNAAWCELTALYWGWKNLKVDYLGLCHYRRYFDCKIDAVERILSSNDIILSSVPSFDRKHNSSGLQWAVSQEDYWIYIDTLLAHHPEYKDAVLKYFYNEPNFVPFTMFIAKKDTYDAFCDFIFSFFFDLEQRVKKHGYTRQNRVMGYFGEWTLGLFVAHQRLKAYKCNVVQIDKNTPPSAIV